LRVRIRPEHVERIRTYSGVYLKREKDARKIDRETILWYIVFMAQTRYVRRPRPAASQKFQKKGFSGIPRSYSRSIAKKRFSRKVLGKFFGGSIRASINPIQRKDVREALDQAGVLGMLDPLAKGKRSRSPSTLTEKEAVDILKKARETIKKNLSERGYGLSERGDYHGKIPKDIYRRAIEEGYNQDRGPSSAEEYRRAQEIRILKARRREVQRQALGLSPISAQRITEERAPRGEERRAGLEERIEKMLPTSGGGTPPTPSKSQSGSSTRQRPASSSPPVFSAHLHLPPRSIDDRHESLPSPAAPELTSGAPDDTQEPRDTHEAPEQPTGSDETTRIDENLPL
jgi:hypothetical protein